jgi:oligoribonuclease NrnB/cAMP/cGMP phosphodiesterase (DHH superfamily)
MNFSKADGTDFFKSNGLVYLYNEKIFYHSDMDGIATAYAYCDQLCSAPNYSLCPIDYTNTHSFVAAQCYGFNSVTFLDFCPSQEIVDTLVSAGIQKITVIDHHAGAAEKIEYVKACAIPNMSVYYDVGAVGACTMPYQILGKAIPYQSKLIGMRDVWDFSDSNAKSFHAWCAAAGPEINDHVAWFEILSGHNIRDLTDRIEIGERLLARTAANINAKVRDTLHWIPMRVNDKSFEVPAVNSDSNISELGNEVATRFVIGVGVVWFVTANSVKLSFRSIEGGNFTALELATSLGGGGHKHAAGATIPLEQFLALITSEGKDENK